MFSPNIRTVPSCAFARAAGRYWLSVFRDLARESRRWRARARAIEDPVLRSLALEAQREKRRSLEGAVAFATFVPRASQRRVVAALVAFQLIFDYLDTVSEQPHEDPIANGRQLNEALLAALAPRGRQVDYYARQCHRRDECYLPSLVHICREALAGLPAFELVAPAMTVAARRIVTYQSLNHGDSRSSHEQFTRWAQAETLPSTGLRWWETGAAAGSSLAVLALIAAAADPTLTHGDTAALHRAYYPWIGALHTLLDSLVDHDEDTSACGQRSLIDYYASPGEVAVRMEGIATSALRRAVALPGGHNHTMLIAAMASFYLSDPHAGRPDASAAKRGVMAAMGRLATPTMVVMRARQVAGLLAGGRS